MIVRDLPGAAKISFINAFRLVQELILFCNIKFSLKICIVFNLRFKQVSAQVNPMLKIIQNPSNAATDIQ